MFLLVAEYNIDGEIEAEATDIAYETLEEALRALKTSREFSKDWEEEDEEWFIYEERDGDLVKLDY